jgi:hypothetical protein
LHAATFADAEFEKKMKAIYADFIPDKLWGSFSFVEYLDNRTLLNFEGTAQIIFVWETYYISRECFLRGLIKVGDWLWLEWNRHSISIFGWIEYCRDFQGQIMNLICHWVLFHLISSYFILFRLISSCHCLCFFIAFSFVFPFCSFRATSEVDSSEPFVEISNNVMRSFIKLSRLTI